MKNSEAPTRKIMNFLYGNMNSKELAEFEKELANNKELQDELKLQKEIDQTLLDEIKIQSFRRKLEYIHEKEGLTKKGIFLNMKNKWYWAAASITVISGTATYSLLKYNQSPNKLYNQYYEVWQPSIITRGLDQEQNMDAIVVLYESGSFNQTIDAIDKLLVKEKNNPQLWLLKGCSYMELNKFDQAIEVFRNFDNSTYTFYTETALWYNALCYLKTNKVDEAKKQMQNIANQGNTYSKEAQDILNKMR